MQTDGVLLQETKSPLHPDADHKPVILVITDSMQLMKEAATAGATAAAGGTHTTTAGPLAFDKLLAGLTPGQTPAARTALTQYTRSNGNRKSYVSPDDMATTHPEHVQTWAEFATAVDTLTHLILPRTHAANTPEETDNVAAVIATRIVDAGQSELSTKKADVRRKRAGCTDAHCETARGVLALAHAR